MFNSIKEFAQKKETKQVVRDVAATAIYIVVLPTLVQMSIIIGVVGLIGTGIEKVVDACKESGEKDESTEK